MNGLANLKHALTTGQQAEAHLVDQFLVQETALAALVESLNL